MSEDQERPDIDPPVDLATVAGLADWGRSQRMSTAVADAIFDEIVATPAPEMAPVRPVRDAGLVLDGTWWRNHTASLAATMVTSTRWTPAA